MTKDISGLGFRTVQQGQPGTTGQAEHTAAARPALPSSAFNALLTSLQRERWDDGRLAVLKQGTLDGSAISVDQVVQVLNAFQWDDGKLDALRTLAPNLTGGDRNAVLNAFKWRDGKQQAAEIVGLDVASSTGNSSSNFTAGTSVRTTIDGVTSNRTVGPGETLVGLDVGDLLSGNPSVRVEMSADTVGPGQSIVGLNALRIG